MLEFELSFIQNSEQFKMSDSPESGQDLCAPALPGLLEQTGHYKRIFTLNVLRKQTKTGRTGFVSYQRHFRVPTVFHTFSFMVLWFFFVFFKNCLRLPDDMYSVMKMT